MHCTYYKVNIACRSVSDINPIKNICDVTCIIAAQHNLFIHKYPTCKSKCNNAH